MSYDASGLPTTDAGVAGYHTSTGALFVFSLRVLSPTAYGPGLLKLVGPRSVTAGTVSPWADATVASADGQKLRVRAVASASPRTVARRRVAAVTAATYAPHWVSRGKTGCLPASGGWRMLRR